MYPNSMEFPADDDIGAKLTEITIKVNPRNANSK
jgi:hypothetical protein